FVTHRIRPTGEWPGTGADWTPPERLPDTVNSDSIDQEPRITPDGNTLYFMSRRSGNPDIWVTQKQPNGEWTPAQPLSSNVNSPDIEHCFMPFNLPGEPETSVFISVRPRELGARPMFTAGGDNMSRSAGYDRAPGPVSTAGGTGGRYDLFWLKTSDIVAYYKANARLS